MDVKAGLRRRATALGARTLRALGRTAYDRGLLSIVVPAYNVELYIDDCLRSLREQDYGHVEIVVVDDESPDGSREIALRHAAEDRRVRVVSRPNGGLSAARNTGAAAAVGEYLTFVDADDTVAPGAYAPMIEALNGSGSDFAVSFYRRRWRGKLDAPGRWIRKAHAEARIGVDLSSFPEVMVNAVAWSKVYRRTFYDATGLRFPEGVIYEDQAVSMRAFARARAFDVLPHVGVEWRIRDDQTSISQQHKQVANLAAHTRATEDSIAELRDAGHDRAAELRALQLLDHNMQFFKLNAVRRDPAYWAELRRAITFLVEQVPREEYLREVGAYKKVLNELIMADRMEDAARFQETRHAGVSKYRTRRVDDLVYVDFGPGVEDIGEEYFRLSRIETSARSQARAVRWVGPHTLRIEGWAYLDNIDLTGRAPRIAVAAVGPGGGRVELDVTVRPDPRADVAADMWYADVTTSGFEADLDTRRLPDDARSWRVEATVEDEGMSGVAAVTFNPWVEAAARRPLVEPSGRAVVVERSRAGRMYLSVNAEPTRATGWRLDGTKLAVDLAGAAPVRVHLADERRRNRARVRGTVAADGRRVDLDLAELAAGRAGRWSLVAVGADGRARPVTDARESGDGFGRLGVERGFDGAVQVVVRDCAVLVEDASVDGSPGSEELRVTVRTDGDFDVPVLAGDGDRVEGTVETGPDGRRVLRFPLTRTVWDHEDLLVPPDRYQIGVLSGGELVVGTPTPELVGRLPVDELHERVRTTLEVFEPASPGVRLTVKPPLRPDERSQRNQRELRDLSRRPIADRPSVFFRTLYGEVSGGNGLGVHQELRRRGADLELCWSIRDHSVWTAPGSRRLIEKTREWHEAIAQSRYHMVDVHQLDWFERPQGQDLIQTMHGYPYKVMGHEWWEKAGFPVRQVANFDRRAREWTYFVSPASYATPLLKEAFLDPAGARPRILEIGYPRNDVLLRPEAAEIRTRTRELLGIGEDRIVVLYGPTFRDYLSTDDTTAARVTFFDPHAAVAALPDEYVVLMRGHAFNARVAGERERSTDRVVDVTDYPDINDLILASDVAVLDYSSLRFDYVLSGNPMVFLVPDLAEYDTTRGGVIPYPPTAPGPHVATTAEVVEWLRELPRLTEEYAAERERFRAEYVDLEDGRAGARLVDAVFVPRGDAPPATDV